MKIALLNLPYDNNYGGNLQRYALMKVLQGMGHDVTHLNLRFNYNLPWYKMPYSYTRRIILKYIFGRNIKINQEQYVQKEYEKRCAITDFFYQKYIKHTESITDMKQLRKFQDFDAYVVGSDQVWRKRIAGKYLYSMFLNFLSRTTKAKRIAYGVSLGVAENELSEEEIKRLSNLYCCFNAVSVRENSALLLFNDYGWTNPLAIQVIDPTLLLHKEDYQVLIANGDTKPTKGSLLCYILDENDDVSRLIIAKERELGLKSFKISLNVANAANIEQWLRSFNDAEFVITDSYHGLIFSIIFNKPFFLIRNKSRGNARFDSVLKILNLTEDGSGVNWNVVKSLIEKERSKALSFLNVLS